MCIRLTIHWVNWRIYTLCKTVCIILWQSEMGIIKRLYNLLVEHVTLMIMSPKTVFYNSEYSTRIRWLRNFYIHQLKQPTFISISINKSLKYTKMYICTVLTSFSMLFWRCDCLRSRFTVFINGSVGMVE